MIYLIFSLIFLILAYWSGQPYQYKKTKIGFYELVFTIATIMFAVLGVHHIYG
jgi:uncharacterized membrane protein YwzB